jgi:CheY-like chemotaxis protein
MQEAHHKGRLTVKTERIANSIRISFKDNGQGIAEGNLAKLFNPFFTTRDPGKGTGLGLSICHSIVTKHAGKIYAQSKLGEGATFFIELPIVNKGEQATPPEQPVAAVAKSASKARILIVDDEPMVQKFIMAVLSGERYALDLMDNGNTTLERLRNQEYDVILLDIKLPGMSGIEIYEELKKSFKPLTRKVIFITGDVMSSDTMTYLKSAGIPYITKPFEAALLVKEIDRIISQ